MLAVAVAAAVDGFPAHAGMDPRPPARCRPAGRLPRTRGDGPAGSRSVTQAAGASPHTRGWTSQIVTPARRSSGFPAHAGMDPYTTRRSGRQARLPRTRGDGPLAAASPVPSTWASPHTRGWTHVSHRPPDLRRGFPAHAGMDPSPGCCWATRARLPRTRGDGPRCSRCPTRRLRASPHTRGWTLRHLRDGVEHPGFPAHAGMDPAGLGALPAGPGLPRTRGDGPIPLIAPHTFFPASPHTRGWTLPAHRRARHDGGFPAHAGMDPADRRRRPAAGGLPRTRGDGPQVWGV